MIDRSEKKAPVNAPNNFNDDARYPTATWEELYKVIFEPCLTPPPGNIFSKQGIQISAGKLVKMVEQLSCVQLTHHEIKDVKDFVDSYRTFLEDMDQGPAGPNGTVKRREGSTDPLHKVFANLGKDLMDCLEAQMKKIGKESEQAENLHESQSDLPPSPSDPNAKASISVSNQLVNTVEKLHRMSKGLSIRPISYQNGLYLADTHAKTPSIEEGNDNGPCADLAC